jgi:hypothetical protein
MSLVFLCNDASKQKKILSFLENFFFASLNLKKLESILFSFHA